MRKKYIKACLVVTAALVTLLYACKMLDYKPSRTDGHEAVPHSPVGSHIVNSPTVNTAENVSIHWRESTLNDAVKQFQLKFKSELNPLKARMDRFLKSFVHVAKARENKTLWRQLDVMNLPLHTFDTEFRNPCWWSNTTSMYTCVYQANTMFERRWRQISYERSHFHCLPYFMIIGQVKTGTSDLFEKIRKHPDVTTISIKEKQWFYRRRLHYTDSCASIDAYIGMFQDGVDSILQHHKAGSINPYVTGDATPGYFSDNIFWDMLPGNEGCKEPCVTNADMIHHITPGAKLILSLRNPTDRLYSYYFHKQGKFGVPTSRKTFHRLVVREIGKFQKCLESQTLRGCCYNYTVSDDFTEQLDLRRGIYHVFLSDWLKVFPRDQIHIIKFEDYVANGSNHLANIFSFLKLKDLSGKELDTINKLPPANRRTTSHRRIGDMWNSTRNILNQFYKPFNRELSALLNNGKFVW